MIKIYVRKNEDDTILCSKILTTSDLIPPVLEKILSSIDCYPEIAVEDDTNDEDFWKHVCFEKIHDNEELLSD